jgi:hypothetical protein
MIDFENVSDTTWQAIELILAIPSLLERCLCEMQASDDAAVAAKLSESFADTGSRGPRTSLSAEARLMGGTSSDEVQWLFVIDVLRGVQSALSADGSLSWTDAVEQSSSA